jgi:hypothetical protein
VRFQGDFYYLHLRASCLFSIIYYQSFKMSLKKATVSKDISNESTESLAFKKVTNSEIIHFPKQANYYIYRPARPDASPFERFSALLSLIYYKYLIHSGVYVMNKNERRMVNSIVVLSVILSSYQLFLLICTVLGY